MIHMISHLNKREGEGKIRYVCWIRIWRPRLPGSPERPRENHTRSTQLAAYVSSWTTATWPCAKNWLGDLICTAGSQNSKLHNFNPRVLVSGLKCRTANS